MLRFPALFALAFTSLLSCLVSFSVSAEEYLAGASSAIQKPMEFEIQKGKCYLAISCYRWIYAHGRITPGSPTRLKALLERVGDERILIAVNSAGGDYEAAMQMGQMIRDHISPVTVAASLICKPGIRCRRPELTSEYAICDYACIFVLLGGSTRTAFEGREMILPRLTDPGMLPAGTVSDVRDGDRSAMVAIVDRYLTPRSLSLDIKDTILNTPTDGWHYVDSQQALSGRLITGFNSFREIEPPAPVSVAEPVQTVQAKLASPEVPQIRVSGLAAYRQPPMNFVLFERAACAGEEICGRWISAEGLIGPTTAAAFKTFVAKRKLEGIPLMIDSAGGDYAAALELGRIARERKLRVGVASSTALDCISNDGCRERLARRKISAGQVSGRTARCDFACVFVLAGGSVRSMPMGRDAALPFVAATSESLRQGDSEGAIVTMLSGSEANQLQDKIRQYLIDMLWDTGLYVSLVQPGNEVGQTSDPVALHRFGLLNTADNPEMLLKPEQPVVPSIIGGAPMQFVVAHSTPKTCKPQCRRWIVADGTITDNSPARLQKLLKSLGKEKLPIVIQSDGGSVGAAMKMGIMIREAGLDVAVGRTEVPDCSGLPEDCLVPAPGRSEIGGKLISGQAVCASACPLMLAGGKRRYASPWSFLVVHTIFDIRPDDKKHPKPEVERIVEAPKSIRKPITRYFKAMGVDPKLFDVMRSASPTSFRIVAPDEALALRLTTHKAPASELVGLAE